MNCESQVDEAAAFVRAFEKVSRQQGNPIRVRGLNLSFRPLGRRLEGYCAIRNMEGNDIDFRIVLNSDLWKDMSKVEREILVFHELGHCALGREHSYARSVFGHPASLMSPVSISEEEYEAHRQSYLAELFQNSQ